MNLIQYSTAVISSALPAGCVHRTLSSRLYFANSDKKNPFIPEPEKVADNIESGDWRMIFQS